jgi:hypothetical protein
MSKIEALPGDKIERLPDADNDDENSVAGG